MRPESRDGLIGVTVSFGAGCLLNAVKVVWAVSTGNHHNDPNLLTGLAVALAAVGCVLTGAGVRWARRHPAA